MRKLVFIISISVILFTSLIAQNILEQSFPALYSQYGMGEDEADWITQGNVNIISENHIAARFSPKSGKDIYEARARFGADFATFLLNDIILFNKKTFRIFTDRGNSAMTDLSWGGYQTFQIAMNNTDQFAYLGGFYGAGMFNPDTALKTHYKSRKSLLMIGRHEGWASISLRSYILTVSSSVNAIK
jgi:S-formylglutathione hydrolase FrmB